MFGYDLRMDMPSPLEHTSRSGRPRLEPRAFEVAARLRSRRKQLGLTIAYLAISNRRLVALDERGVSFRWKDYRTNERTRHKTMTLSPEEFMRRFLLHVLPDGFHRIRHYGLLANVRRRENLARVRNLLTVSSPVAGAKQPEVVTRPRVEPPTFVCPCCGAAMAVIETLVRIPAIRAPPGPGGVP